MANFQVSLGSTWADYAPSEDSLLRKAFLAGHPLCKFSLHGASYECDFKRMVQKNLVSGKERKIRPPSSLQKSTAECAENAPPGGVASVTVPSKSSNNSDNDNNKKIAVIVPEGNLDITGVVVGARSKKSWTTKQRAAAGAAAGALGAAAVGGTIAGAHAAGRDGGDGDVPSGPDHCHGGFYYDHCHDGSYYVPPGCDGSYYVPPGCDGSYYVPPGCDGSHYVPPGCDGSYYVPPPPCDHTSGAVDYGCEPVPVPPPAESACGIPGEDYAEPWEPCGDDAAGFYEGDADGFEDGADFDAESGEAVADLITCMF